MMNLLKKWLLKTGLFEDKNLCLEGSSEVLLIAAGETFSGSIHTKRDVLVRGTVVGDIFTPHGCVVIMPEGAITDGTVWAKDVIWKGSMGGNRVHCSHVLIVPGAQSVQAKNSPQLFHESMTIGKIGALDVSFTRQQYQAEAPVRDGVDGQALVARTTRDLLAAT